MRSSNIQPDCLLLSALQLHMISTDRLSRLIYNETPLLDSSTNRLEDWDARC